MLKAPISVIIPTWNRCELLLRCLDSLASQTVEAGVVVIDNGSADGTAETVESCYPKVRLIRNPSNLGFARAVNQGIQETDSPYVALLNNDTEADPAWIESGLAALSSFPEYGFFASRMVNFDRRDRLDSAGDCYSRFGLPYKRGFGASTEAYLQREEVLGASAGAAFYRREVFEVAGLFDEGYRLYLEDVELSLRARLHGFRCLYLPEAIVYHVEAASDPERVRGPHADTAFYSPDRVFWITRNRWQLMLSYGPIRYLPFYAFGWVKSFLFHLLKAGFTADFLRGLGAGMALSGTALKKRRQLNRTKALGTGDLCRMIQKC